MRSASLVNALPRAFVGFAFFNFLVGAVLGGWMASAPRMWSTVGPIHGEINPFGWLTMLIYGMTYAVLALSAGIRPPRAWVGWLHLCVAEIGVLVTVAAYTLHSRPLLLFGLTVQAVAPVLFLVNILSAVFASRRQSQTGAYGKNRSAQVDTTQVDSSGDTAPVALELSFLWRSDEYKATDRVARRGTDIALMMFIVGAWWMAFSACFGWTFPQNLEPKDAILLIYYGWIAGTVLAVSLHLFPRLTQITSLSATVAGIVQVLWGIGVLLVVAGTGAPVLASVGVRLLGLSFTWFASIYLWSLGTSRPSVDGSVPMTQPTRVAWSASFVFAWVLGVCLLLGTHPLSLFSLHLLFLAWITTLVYGVGYTLFPMILARESPHRHIAHVQLSCSVVGATFMVIAFSPATSMFVNAAQAVNVLLAAGGVLAALGAVMFVVQWPLTRPRRSGKV